MSLDAGSITAIQSKLSTLGFRLFNDLDAGIDNQWFRTAIREFQIYAAYPTIACVDATAAGSNWVDGLVACANTAPYTGLPDGNPTSAVNQLIDEWVTKKYRCPVVIDLYVRGAKERFHALPQGAPLGNYWRWDDDRVTLWLASAEAAVPDPYDLLQLRAFDFSNCKPGTRPAEFVRLGRLKLWSKALISEMPKSVPPKQKGRLPRTYVGPALQDARTTSALAEVTPETLIGPSWSKLTLEQQRTFRVVRAVSERECTGFFDNVNGYDNAYLSVGLFHWTLTVGERLPDGLSTPTEHAITVPFGELDALFSYWRMSSPAEAARSWDGKYHVTFTPEWKPNKPGPRDGWESTRTYVGGVVLPGATTPATTPTELQWFRTSHWFWRMVHLSRTEPTFRKAQWAFARLRIRDVLAKPYDPTRRPGQTGTGATVPLSTLFTSELAVALLLRCHVLRPKFINQSGYGTNLEFALLLSGIDTNLPASKWKEQEQQERLVDGIIAVTALAGLSPQQRGELKKLKDEKLLEKLRSYLADPPKILNEEAKGLRDACALVRLWPQESRFQWHYSGKKPNRAKAPFALDRAACKALSTAPDFKLDTSDLPPLPT